MTLLEPEVVEDARLDDGDHERFAHIVNAPKGQSAEARITQARVMGTPVRAICGKQWIPQKDPKRFPVCPDCIKEYERVTGKKWSGA